MKNLLLLLFLGLAGGLTAQLSEPLVHPEQLGSYGAPADAILVAEGGPNQTVFKTASTLGLDASATNEAQTLAATGTTTPTLTLTSVSGTGGGTVTLAGAGGITLGQSAGTITITQTAGANYTGTAPVTVTGSTISLAPSGVAAGTYNNVTVATNGTVTAASNATYLTTETQVLSRTATTNVVNLTGGTNANVEDVMAREEFAPTTGSTVTLVGTLPTDVDKYVVERNGMVQNYGAGKGVISINTSTKVVTFTRAFSAGEIVLVRYPKQ
jgi:hypothetical protein